MIVASMTQSVSTPRCGTSGFEALAATAHVLRSEPNPVPGALAEIPKRARVAGVDLDLDAHARAQRRRAFRHLDPQAHGHALHDLDPIPGGVLGRQHRELCPGSRADAGDA